MMSLKEFYTEYICLNLKDFPNFGIDFEINKLVCCLIFALCAASIYFNIIESDIALILKKLLRAGAVGEEKAKSLSDLGLASSSRIRRLVAKDISSLRRIISVVGAKKLTYEEFMAKEKQKKENSFFKRFLRFLSDKFGKKSIDEETNGEKKEFSDNDSISEPLVVNDPKIYIPEENLSIAEKKYSRNDSSVLKTVGICLILLALGLVVIILMPSLLSFIST